MTLVASLPTFVAGSVDSDCDCDWYVTAVREAADWTVAPLSLSLRAKYDQPWSWRPSLQISLW